MADLTKTVQNLEQRGFVVHCFDTAEQAADYLDQQIDQTSVSFGGSITAQQMGLYPRLAAHNQAIWHWEGGSALDAMTTDAYITSVNALAETGELINIDGTGNRVAATFFGHRRIYFVVGINKLAPDYDAALWRARNIASPKNAQRLGRKTPCAAKGDRCYDCQSPERICRGLSVLWGPLMGAQVTEVLLINQELGY
ncbi:lactate utilization protein [Pseudoflavonifractor sp. AF19-9AC]|uniref:lactate utilization protein n=1 Tax=Pseudoflavonifractor sp. AF19-9AC TaxID=2292244 RepID=UPI000E48A017|nr:lactate utilization protein [Pseudoflavonifractor sp. AF19-9AC]RHR10957.1 lactate utilization protein [Pseudoflavonifractor sp. AF19-9AC]